MYLTTMNIEAAIQNLVETLNAKFATEGDLTVKRRKCRGYAKLVATKPNSKLDVGTIVFIDLATGAMHQGGNVQNDADRAALIAQVFRGR